MTAPLPSLDPAEVAKAARAYRSHINRTKASLRVDFPWYPYETLASFEILDRLLEGPWRAILSDLRAGSIADIGSGDGANSFFLESLGFRVTAIDLPAANHNGMRGIRTLRDALGSSIDIAEANLDARFTLPARDYSLIVMLGVLYHLKNPFYALEYLANAAPYAFISTRVFEAAPDSRNLAGIPAAYLVDPHETNNDPTNFWIFTEAGLHRLLKRTGWDVIATHLTSTSSGRPADPVHADADRRAFVFLRSCRGGALKPRFVCGFHEVEPDGWRWTERRFSVECGPVASAADVALTLDIAMPESVLDAYHGAVELRLRVNGHDVGAQALNCVGEHTLDWTIRNPGPGILRLDFELDKAMPPGAADQRELGIIVLDLSARVAPNE